MASGGIKQRIRLIAKRPKMLWLTAAVLTVIVVAVCITACTGAVAAKPSGLSVEGYDYGYAWNGSAEAFRYEFSDAEAAKLIGLINGADNVEVPDKASEEAPEYGVYIRQKNGGVFTLDAYGTDAFILSNGKETWTIIDEELSRYALSLCMTMPAEPYYSVYSFTADGSENYTRSPAYGELRKAAEAVVMAYAAASTYHEDGGVNYAEGCYRISAAYSDDEARENDFYIYLSSGEARIREAGGMGYVPADRKLYDELDARFMEETDTSGSVPAGDSESEQAMLAVTRFFEAWNAKDINAMNELTVYDISGMEWFNGTDGVQLTGCTVRENSGVFPSGAENSYARTCISADFELLASDGKYAGSLPHGGNTWLIWLMRETPASPWLILSWGA